jgi:hypothetical protein
VITRADVLAARKRISGYVRHTPMLRPQAATEPLWLKCEFLQRTGVSKALFCFRTGPQIPCVDASLVTMAAVQAYKPGVRHHLEGDETLGAALEYGHSLRTARSNRLHQTTANSELADERFRDFRIRR